jgi:hypothetical protein
MGDPLNLLKFFQNKEISIEIGDGINLLKFFQNMESGLVA